jgi:ribosome-associated heat shock protein Hsp15
MSGSNANVRLDSWLWAARFFKTRSLAKSAIEGGKVEVDGRKAKPGKTVAPGLRLVITKEPQTFEVEVLDVAAKRGPASQAEQLYRETDESRRKREEAAENRRAAAGSRPAPPRRPDRRDRRTLRRLRQGGGQDRS